MFLLPCLWALLLIFAHMGSLVWSSVLCICSVALFCCFFFFYLCLISHGRSREKNRTCSNGDHVLTLYLLFSPSFLLYSYAQQCIYLFFPSCKGHRCTSGPWCRKNSACTDNISWILMGHFASSMYILFFLVENQWPVDSADVLSSASLL